LSYTELGSFSFTYRSLGVHGIGISSSSSFAVLYEASQLYLKQGPPLPPEDVAKAALRFERRLALGSAVAADDVFPITFGGVLKVHTEPNTVNDGVMSDGEVSVEAIPHDPRWIADHVVVAFDPLGERHDVPNLLGRLFEHKDAAKFVDRFSELADVASKAIESRDCDALAGAMNEYREEFDRWTGKAHTQNVRDVGKRLPRTALAWKPPGAGASRSLIVITPDREGRDVVIEFFKDKHRWATPTYTTSGLCGEFLRSDGQVRITAGHRLDFIGAADLGQNVHLQKPGQCCSCAIEPRTEILFESDGPRRGT
jgi:hypothetical protein